MFENYLMDRNQRTIANDTLSNIKNVKYGVPQGSVMGPVLFSIYINSLPNVYDFDITLYADDAVITVTEPERMQLALNNIATWCCTNSLTVNEKKTKWMMFNNPKNYVPPIFTLNNVVLDNVKTFPYLGLTLDSELKFIEHRANTTKSIRHKIYQLSRVRNYIDEITALTIYKSMILSSFDYVDYIWDRGNIGESNELQLMQNRCLRLVYRVKLEAHPTFTTVQLHVKGNCRMLELRRDMHLLSYAFSLKKLDSYTDNRNLPTRLNMGIRLLVPKSVKPIILRSFHYRAIIKWNCLKQVYTELEDLDVFKINIKKNYDTCFM